MAVSGSMAASTSFFKKVFILKYAESDFKQNRCLRIFICYLNQTHHQLKKNKANFKSANSTETSEKLQVQIAYNGLKLQYSKEIFSQEPFPEHVLTVGGKLNTALQIYTAQIKENLLPPTP